MSKNTISDRGRSRCTAVARSGDHDAGLIFRLETEPASQVLKQAVVFFRGGGCTWYCAGAGVVGITDRSKARTTPNQMRWSIMHLLVLKQGICRSSIAPGGAASS